MADLLRTPEQQLLGDAVRGFLAGKGGVAATRDLLDSPIGYDPGGWTQMARELGLQGIAIPEAFGGSGFSRADLAVVLEEMGRVLLPGPFLASSVLAVEVLLAAGDDAVNEEILPGIASGELVATVAPGGAALRGWHARTGVQAAQVGGGWLLTGVSTFVLDGCAADLLIVHAESDSGAGLFTIRADHPGLVRTPLRTLDLTRRQARLEFTNTPATRLQLDRGVSEVIGHALRHTAVALAAEQVGGAQRCLEMTVEYAKTRVQFGKPIGSFQAVKHKCADLLLEVESARSAARYAAAIASSEDAGVEFIAAAALAGAYCSQAFFRVAAETVQVHGGIGFTWEHDAQLYFRRAKAGEVMFGTPVEHRAVLAGYLSLAETNA